MKRNAITVRTSQYNPSNTTVTYNGHKLLGNWYDLGYSIITNNLTYRDVVRKVRAALRKGVRQHDHYAVVRFADSGNVYAAGYFTSYQQLKNVLHSTGRTLTISFK